MNAPTSLLAVLLLLSCASLGQAAPVQAQPTAQAQQAAQSQASIPSPSPSASTSSTEAGAATADGVPAASFGPTPFAAGAKLFLEPMDGFEQLLSEAILKKKVPVVIVKERAKADFVLSGGAHVHKRGFFTGMVLNTNGKGSISIKDARTGNQVFAYNFHRVDGMTTVGQDYQNWADACAKHLKKALEKK